MKRKGTLEKIINKPVEACDICIYSKPILGDNEAIRCHRYPLSNRANLTHWCGEFKAK